jgi:hypothetical protein
MAWLPGYEQIPILGCTGPGTYKFGTPWKIVLHTTESPFGSSPGIVRLFQSQPCSTPHFCIDPGTGRKIQFIPIDMSAAALRGGQGGYETNRAHAVQVEICGYAQEAGGWSDEVLRFIGGWVADVAKAVPINLGHVTGSDYQGTVAVASSPYRMSGPQFEAFDGVCGHIDVPFNDHYDPYHLNKQKVVQHALDQLGTHTEQDWLDMATKQEVQDAFTAALLNPEVAKNFAYWINNVGAAQGAADKMPGASIQTVDDKLAQLIAKP